MEDINLHFTGDFHAITTAHNLLAAVIDNHIQHGNELDIDVRRVVWKRVLDLNDRALRHVVVGMGGKAHGVPRETGFDITVASEMMAIFCLSKNLMDMKKRLRMIIVAYTRSGKPVIADDLHVTGALTLLFKDAIKPNIVQTLEGTPVLIHGGPFANIAHGCNSVIATKYALKFADYVITEAGFGADLGAEKFLDIKCRFAGLCPDAVVIVATVRALKMHGGLPKDQLDKEDPSALENGFSNLEKHIESIHSFGLPVWGKGGAGGIELAEKVEEAMKEPKDFHFIYDVNESIPEKLEKIAHTIYGADGVDFTPAAKKQLDEAESLGFDRMPVCVAKTQYSLSDDATKLGRPKGFRII